MQDVAEASAYLSAHAAISNFEPCTLFVPAKISTRLANHGKYVEDNGRFGSLTVSLRVSLHEDFSECTESTVPCMAVLSASTTNNRMVRWLKVNPKLRSPCFRTNAGSRQFGCMRSLVGSLRRDVIELVVE
jgi:hypothetical protein